MAGQAAAGSHQSLSVPIEIGTGLYLFMTPFFTRTGIHLDQVEGMRSRKRSSGREDAADNVVPVLRSQSKLVMQGGRPDAD
jgi:hypothetical protein